MTYEALNTLKVVEDILMSKKNIFIYYQIIFEIK